MHWTEEIFDVALVGLGPAGATFARLVSPKFRVVAFDKKSTEPHSFRKPCGGLLAEDAQLALSRQGLPIPNSILTDPQIFAVRTIDLCQEVEQTYRRFYINIDRHGFDLWLKSLIPQSVKVCDDTPVRKISRTLDELWEIRFFEGKTERVVRAKTIIGADGASSIVRKALFPDHKIRCYTALQQWYQDDSPTPVHACFFDERLTDCYGWAVSKNKELVFGAAFPRGNTGGAYEKLRRRVKDFGFTLENPLRTEACQVLRPEKMSDFKIGNPDGAFLLGEAAGFISPSSLEGISYALDSGEMLADAFNAYVSRRNRAQATPRPLERGGAGGRDAWSFAASAAEDQVPSWKIFEKYRFSTRKICVKLLLKTLKNPFIYNPRIRALIMKSGISSIRLRKDAED